MLSVYRQLVSDARADHNNVGELPQQHQRKAFALKMPFAASLMLQGLLSHLILQHRSA